MNRMLRKHKNRAREERNTHTHTHDSTGNNEAEQNTERILQQENRLRELNESIKSRLQASLKKRKASRKIYLGKP